MIPPLPRHPSSILIRSFYYALGRAPVTLVCGGQNGSCALTGPSPRLMGLCIILFVLRPASSRSDGSSAKVKTRSLGSLLLGSPFGRWLIASGVLHNITPARVSCGDHTQGGDWQNASPWWLKDDVRRHSGHKRHYQRSVPTSSGIGWWTESKDSRLAAAEGAWQGFFVGLSPDVESSPSRHHDEP